ncbi:MAG: tRNA uridine-5-carboxymethylaminomethyl(34) synthesis GTPase MnmE [Chitinophagales bacterium]|nr:tRNA uridine-5-carboxymethylaminomethyl(34) synthesis GTPase MnmE [Chitinophagales bacterium]MDW8393164.1 tRNA uridine-5-carboxymethylaminomethyl(34) synthesis GTPase MnmE [Chitinophagales bacterium]
MNYDDTVAALATPEGVGALAIVRLSGNNALAIADQVFRPKKLSRQPSHTAHVGWLEQNGQMVDEAVAVVFRAPRSYTREDMVEFTIHGSPYLARRVLDLLLEQGARLARPGEFTLRAFLNGRLDLAQAEAVADLIAAQTDSAHRYALQHLRGGYSAQLARLRERLLQLAALLELELDFSEENVEFASRSELLQLADEGRRQIAELLGSFRWGNAVREGVTTTIAGRPNAGKSTLLNALLQEDRAIVSELPGTTRDTLEEVLVLEGIRFRLIDTAGLREASDQIEQSGIQRALNKIQRSSVVLYVFDVTAVTDREVQEDISRLPLQGAHLIAVGNKIDRAEAKALSNFTLKSVPLVWISAQQGTGLNELRAALVNAVSSGSAPAEQVVVTNVRHAEALQRAGQALEEAQKGLRENRSKELIASDLRQALDALGEILGTVTSEQLLDFIFSNFCIGK